jgi:hypothetical protein
MQRSGWEYLIGCLSDPRIDLGAMLAHYGLCVGIPLLFWSGPAVAGLYVARIICMG